MHQFELMPMLPATGVVVSKAQLEKKSRALRMTVYGRTLTVISPVAVVRSHA